jgi:hypothetical protein
MNHKLLAPLFLVPLATACGASDDEPIRVTQATLTQAGDTGPAKEAHVDWDGWMIYGAYRQVDGVDMFHHVEIIDYRGTDGPELAVGETYFDGPEVNGRGRPTDWLGDEGYLVGDFPIPWLDALVCEGTSYETMTNCRQAAKVEVKLSDADDEAVRFDYRLWMEGDVDPSVSGTFTAEHGKIGQIPGE